MFLSVIDYFTSDAPKNFPDPEHSLKPVLTPTMVFMGIKSDSFQDHFLIFTTYLFFHQD
jgi:hypothetical protein